MITKQGSEPPVPLASGQVSSHTPQMWPRLHSVGQTYSHPLLASWIFLSPATFLLHLCSPHHIASYWRNQYREINEACIWNLTEPAFYYKRVKLLLGFICENCVRLHIKEKPAKVALADGAGLCVERWPAASNPELTQRNAGCPCALAPPC